MKFLVDSGSPSTFLDYSLYLKLGGLDSDLAHCDISYETASGGPLTLLGSADFDMCIDDIRTRQKVIVARLGAPYGLLGCDFLSRFDVGLFVGRGEMEVKGQTIKLSRRSVPCCRVLLEDNVTIPKWSEKNIFGGLSHRGRPDLMFLALWRPLVYSMRNTASVVCSCSLALLTQPSLTFPYC